jgi:hypothetical protein
VAEGQFACKGLVQHEGRRLIKGKDEGSWLAHARHGVVVAVQDLCRWCIMGCLPYSCRRGDSAKAHCIQIHFAYLIFVQRKGMGAINASEESQWTAHAWQ